MPARARNVKIASLTVTNGDGHDNTEIGGGTQEIAGNVTIANGVGGSFVSLGVDPANVTTVGGAVKITNLDGTDDFEANGTTATFTGPITISNGSGGSNINFAASTNT